MKCFVAIASALVLAAAAPAPQLSHSHANAIVYIRLIGDANQHYSLGETQTPSTPSGTVIPVLVGQSLDFSSNAPRLQAIDISRISPGGSLEGVDVSENDERVLCEARIDGSSHGPAFSVKHVRVLLDQGRMAKLAELTCWLDHGGA